jgi:exosortase A-associated hydrolase 1
MVGMSEPLWQEEALAISLGAERLVGVLTRPARPRDTGIVIVVGGPQYRAGSHRQFVLLARALAAAGMPALRFDVRGMGDSTGPMQSFEASTQDLAGAIDAFAAACPAVRQVVLWGLCDAASIILLHAASAADARIAGLVLVNPWVRSEASHARTQLVHYYAKRLLARDFWKKLARRDVDLRDGAASVARHVATAARAGARPDGRQFQDRMADGLRSFTRPVLLLLSGQDLTAREFEDYARDSVPWRGLLEAPCITRADFDDADHTFSTAEARESAETRTVQWLLDRVAGEGA